MRIFDLKFGRQTFEKPTLEFLERAFALFIRDGLSLTLMETISGIGGSTADVKSCPFTTKEDVISALLEIVFQYTAGQMLESCDSAGYADLSGLERLRLYITQQEKILADSPEIFIFFRELESAFARKELSDHLLKKYTDGMLPIRERLTESYRIGVKEGTVRKDTDIGRASSVFFNTLMALLQHIAAMSRITAGYDSASEISIFADSMLGYLKYCAAAKDNNNGYILSSSLKTVEFPEGEGKTSADKNLILIVDDEWVNRAILSKMFSGIHATAEAENGAAALEYLKRHGRKVKIILLDLLMPVMDGFELLALIKADETLKNIPIIITSVAGEKSEERALAMGADEFIAKPYVPAVLRQRVETVLENARLRAEMRATEGRNEIIKEAFFDYLTGIYNRRGFETTLRAGDFSDKEMLHAFYMLDMDNLKMYNDTRGHSWGDSAIKAFAYALKENLRTYDIAARIGGDEFVVLLKNLPSKETALQRGSDFCTKVCQSGFEDPISCSVGLTVFKGEPNMKRLMEEADAALYAAKRRGRHCCCIWDEATMKIPYTSEETEKRRFDNER